MIYSLPSFQCSFSSYFEKPKHIEHIHDKLKHTQKPLHWRCSFKNIIPKQTKLFLIRLDGNKTRLTKVFQNLFSDYESSRCLLSWLHYFFSITFILWVFRTIRTRYKQTPKIMLFWHPDGVKNPSSDFSVNSTNRW